MKDVTPLLVARSGNFCELAIDAETCRRMATQRHHRQLLSQGGPNALHNLLHVCAKCHAFIHEHPTIAYEMGWLVHSWDDPLTVPVKRERKGARELWP